MLLGNITQNGIEICKVGIPENFGEWRYDQYIQYSLYMDDLYSWSKKKIENEEPYEGEYLIRVAKAVSKILSIDYNIILNTKYKEQEWIYSAWHSFEKQCISFTPDNNGGEFIHGEKMYRIPKINKSVIDGKIYSQDLTYQQIAEAVELERVLHDAIKAIEVKKEVSVNGKVYSELDAKVSTTVTQTVKKIALVLSDGKEIPTDHTFDEWIDNKALELKDISAINALNTLFFLMNMSKGLEMLIELSGILNLYRQESTKRMAKHTMNV